MPARIAFALSLLVLCLGVALGIGSDNTTVINDVPKAPSGPKKYITDLADLITPADEQMLLSYLQRQDQSGKGQIAIVTVPNTDRELAEFAPQILKAWGVGHKDTDDGLVILANAERIKKKLSGNRIFVATGIGIQAILPDALVGRVLDQEAIPRFEEGDYSGGLRATTLAYAQIMAGDEKLVQAYKASPKISWFEILFFLFILWILIFNRRNIRWSVGYGGSGGYDGGGFGGGGFGGGRGDGGGAGR